MSECYWCEVVYTVFMVVIGICGIYLLYILTKLIREENKEVRGLCEETGEWCEEIEKRLGKLEEDEKR